jgi:rod shape-determining protein MreD
MTRTRALAALAAILTALLLQATVVGPVTLPVAVSLPAVLVAAVALVDGPGAGLSIGFVTGLLADLGSNHPAGVLALCWMALGLLCGCVGGVRTVRVDAAFAALACAAASLLADGVLAATRTGSVSAGAAFAQLIPVALGDAVLALAVVPAARAMLRNDALRPRRSPAPDLARSVGHG